MPTDTPPLPRKRFEVSLRISAFTWEEVVRTAQELADHLHEHGPVCSLVGGGRIVHIVEDATMTRERWEADLSAWADAHRAAKAADAR